MSNDRRQATPVLLLSCPACRRNRGPAARPESRYYESQGLRLHYADWGNEGAPPCFWCMAGAIIAAAGMIARALQPHFHVLAPDLRGHGDSDWTKGGSYALTEYVYDLSRLVRRRGGAPGDDRRPFDGRDGRADLCGHVPGSGFGAGGSRWRHGLAGCEAMPAHERIAKWVGQLDKLEDREPRRYRTIEEAAAQMRAHNTRLPPRTGAAPRHVWRAGETRTTRTAGNSIHTSAPWAPHRLLPEDHVSLWSRITCPTLLLHAEESFLQSAKAAGLAELFPNARTETIAGAGHWLHHDKPDEVLRAIRAFLGLGELS